MPKYIVFETNGEPNVINNDTSYDEFEEMDCSVEIEDTFDVMTGQAIVTPKRAKEVIKELQDKLKEIEG